MNWYSRFKQASIQKLAFPYGRVRCPYVHPEKGQRTCGATFIVDFGRVEHERISTQNPVNHPWKELENRKYENPIPEYDPASGETYPVSQDVVERGTVVLDCPHCKRSMEVEYEQDRAKLPVDKMGDFFGQVSVTDVVPLDNSLVPAYTAMGIPPVASVRESELA